MTEPTDAMVAHALAVLNAHGHLGGGWHECIRGDLENRAGNSLGKDEAVVIAAWYDREPCPIEPPGEGGRG